MTITRPANAKTRVCRYCDKPRPITQFRKNNNGRRGWKCLECRRKHRRDYDMRRKAGLPTMLQVARSDKLKPDVALKRAITQRKIPPAETFEQRHRAAYWDKDNGRWLPALILGERLTGPRPLWWLVILEYETKPFVALFDKRLVEQGEIVK